MKTMITAFAILLCGITLLNSCAVSKNSIALDKVKNVTEGPASCFIQLNDGTIKQFTTLKLVTGILTQPHLLGDGKIVIHSKEIIAYQNNKHYAVSSKILTSTKSANISVETLPGFAVKVLSGKLNVYCRKYYNGSNATNEYFLQSGNDGYIIAYSKEVMKDMIKEDAKALEYFNSKTKISPSSKKLLMAAELYNKGEFFSKQ